MTRQEIESQAKDQIFLLFSGLVAYNKDLVVFQDYSGPGTTEFSVIANKADQPRIQGKGGVLFKAVKLIVERTAEVKGLVIHLTEIRESITGKIERFPSFQKNPHWEKQAISQMLYDVFQWTMEKGVIGIEERERLGSGRCTFTVKLSDWENPELVKSIGDAAKVLFNSIGLNAGCVITVDVITEKALQNAVV